MEDFVITRELPTVGLNRVQGSKDGQILMQVKNGIILLNTNENCNGKPKSLSDLFTLSRLSVSGPKCENFLRNVGHEGLPKFAEFKTTSGGLDFISFTNISISDSGVSETLKCLYLCATDAYNGIIFNYENGSLNPICMINEHIADVEGIRTDTLLSEKDVAKLRINYVSWIKGIDYKYFTDAIWPLPTSSMFLCFTESPETWVYQYDCYRNEISRKFSIDFGLNAQYNEHILYCEQGEWKATANEGLLSINIVVATSANRVIVKKIFYDTVSNTWVPEEDTTVLSYEDYIVNLKMYSVQGKDILSVLFSNSIKIYSIGEADEVGIDLNNVITMDNFIEFGDSKDGDLMHLLLSNSFGYLIHIVFNVHDFTVVSNQHYNYQEKIKSEDLPIFKKLNHLSETHAGSIVIDSLNLDPTGRLTYLTYLPSHMKSNFEFSNEKKDPIRLGIVKNNKETNVKFDVKKDFNSITSTPIYWKSVESQMLGVGAHIVKNDTRFVHGVEEDGSSVSILKKLFLNAELDSERINSVLGSTEDKAKFKKKIQQYIAKEVMKLVESRVVETGSDEDLFIYFQYSKLLNKSIPEKSICKLRVHGKNSNIYERFDAGLIDVDKCIADGGVVQSLEGHFWKLCDITLLPILSPVVQRCVHCGSVKRGSGEGSVLRCVVEATGVCPFCGGRYV